MTGKTQLMKITGFGENDFVAGVYANRMSDIVLTMTIKFK